MKFPVLICLGLLLSLAPHAWGQAGLPPEDVQKRYPEFAPYYAMERHFVEKGPETVFGSDEASTKLAQTFHEQMEKEREKLAATAEVPKEAVAAAPMITFARKARGAYIYIIQPPEWPAYEREQREAFIYAAVRHANVTSFKDGGAASILLIAIRIRNNDNQIIQGRVLEQEDGAPASTRRVDFHGGEVFLAYYFSEGEIGVKNRSEEDLTRQIVGKWRHYCYGTDIYSWYNADGTHQVVYMNGKKLQWRGEGTWRVEGSEIASQFIKEKSTIPRDIYGPENEDYTKIIWLESGPKGKMVLRGDKDWQSWVPRADKVPSYESYLTEAPANPAP